MTRPGPFSGIYHNSPSPVARAVVERQYKRKVVLQPHLYWWKLRSPNGLLTVVGATEAERLNVLRDIKVEDFTVLNYYSPPTRGLDPEFINRAREGRNS